MQIWHVLENKIQGAPVLPVDPACKAGGTAHAAGVDALDEQMVNTYLDVIVRDAGSIDILFNGMGPQPKDYGNATDTLKLPLEKFMLPLTTLVPSQFITARATRHMVRQKSGVIISLTATPSRGLSPGVTAIGAAFGPIGSLPRGLAVELGLAGVRVVGIRSGGMVDTRTMQQTVENVARTMNVPTEQVISMFGQRTLPKRIPAVDDTAKMVAFLASAGARVLTAPSSTRRAERQWIDRHKTKRRGRR